MASDQGNPSAFSCAMGGKKKQTLEENSFSLYRNWVFGAGDGGEQNQAWQSLSPALSVTGKHPGPSELCGSTCLHSPSSVLWITQEYEGCQLSAAQGKQVGSWCEAQPEGSSAWAVARAVVRRTMVKSFARSLCFLSCLKAAPQALQGKV